MLTFRAYRCPGSNFTNSVSTSVAYVGLYEDGRPIGRVWAKRRDASDNLVWAPARISVIWPLNKGLHIIPAELEQMPQHRIEFTGCYGRNAVTLADGRRSRLPLATGGYLTSAEGEMVALDAVGVPA